MVSKKILGNFLEIGELLYFCENNKQVYMSPYVIRAKEKYNRDKKINMMLGFIDYICDCYCKLNPCSYGKMVENKIKDMINVDNVRPKDNMGDFRYLEKYGEIKVTYLSSEMTYCITHIRNWQKFDYYLLCMIDCVEDFHPNFYLIPKYVIDKLSLTPMNGTKDSNMDNKNIEYRVTFKKDSPQHKILMKYNLLGDSSYDSLIKYFV